MIRLAGALLVALLLSGQVLAFSADVNPSERGHQWPWLPFEYEMSRQIMADPSTTGPSRTVASGAISLLAAEAAPFKGLRHRPLETAANDMTSLWEAILLSLGVGAAAATMLAFWACDMTRLRVAAIAANVLFIGYGALGGIWPVLGLHLLLLPLNLRRLFKAHLSTGSANDSAACKNESFGLSLT